MTLRVRPSGNETAQRIIHHPVTKGGASSPSVRAPLKIDGTWAEFCVFLNSGLRIIKAHIQNCLHYCMVLTWHKTETPVIVQ